MLAVFLRGRITVMFILSFLYSKLFRNKYISLMTSKKYIRNCHFKNCDFQVKMAERTFTSNFIPSKNSNQTIANGYIFFTDINSQGWEKQ